MRKLLFLVLSLFVAVGTHAQSTSHTWIDVTASPYSAKNDCSTDAGPAINSAISGAPTGSGVIFFPTGCYLIKTQIVDTNSSAWLTYLGFGTVQLQASNTALPRCNCRRVIAKLNDAVAWRDVFNSGSGNVSLVCDSGTVNGQSSLSIASQTGKTVMSDGTNCFAH